MSQERRKSSLCQNFRRLSKASNVIANRRLSKVPAKLVRNYQPTYQLNSKKSFDAEKIEKLLKHLVDPELEEIEYSDKVIPDLCVSLTELIRNAIKEEEYNRYRIIVCVSIGQRRQQGVHVFHSFLWDPERDAFAAYNYENCHLFANIVVYGVYFD